MAAGNIEIESKEVLVCLQRDDFSMRLPPLGSLTVISIGHDGPRDYHLEKVFLMLAI